MRIIKSGMCGCLLRYEADESQCSARTLYRKRPTTNSLVTPVVWLARVRVCCQSSWRGSKTILCPSSGWPEWQERARHRSQSRSVGCCARNQQYFSAADSSVRGRQGRLHELTCGESYRRWLHVWLECLRSSLMHSPKSSRMINVLVTSLSMSRSTLSYPGHLRFLRR